MFTTAVLIGLFSYLIFILGLAKMLYVNYFHYLIALFILLLMLWKIKKIRNVIYSINVLLKGKIKLNLIKNNILFLILLCIFILQIAINLIGVLGPELAFDALWYHLTIPKIWLRAHSIFFIPGGLFYYSAMPKLSEMLYLAGLGYGNEITSKLIHFSFGILTCFAIYKISCKFFNPLISLTAVVIFYSNLVIAWESITAYIDLIRAFYEIMALWAFIKWFKSDKWKWLVISAIIVGFAITTKLLAVGSLIIFSILILMQFIRNSFETGRNFAPVKVTAKKFTQSYWRIKRHFTPTNTILLITKLFTFWLTALLIPLPWLLFSYISTGNPFYPFFTEIYKISPQPLNVVSFFVDTWNLFLFSPDPISPIYLIFIPLIIYCFSKFKMEVKIITLYSLMGIIVWYFTPRTGGGRFIVAYLPAMSIVCAACLQFFTAQMKRADNFFIIYLIFLTIFVSFITIGYRSMANMKYLPVILGLETKDAFLSNHLNFSYGDFYDIDKYFENHIKKSDKVLLIGFHNLYYVNFPFIDSTWVNENDRFNYIATQNTNLPEKNKDWKLVYKNDRTMVKLYKR